MEGYGPAILRWVVGAILVVHGLQALSGFFSGPRPASADSMGMSAASVIALALGAAGCIGGLLLMAGAFTRWTSAVLALRTLVLYWMPQLAQPFGGSIAPRDMGLEATLVVLAALFCLLLTGPGAPSVDERRMRSAEAYAAGRARLRSRY